MAATLKPEIRLVQVISEFEADLQREEKVEFRELKLKNSNAPHVMLFIAQFDEILFQKGIRRAYGPRLVNFLTGLSLFAAAGYTNIGASQSSSYHTIWTLVTFVLRAVALSGSHLDKVTAFFMDIGRFHPQHYDLGSLSHSSPYLQTCFIEYHILIVQVCHEIHRMTRMSKLKQLFSSFDGMAAEFRTELQRWAECIREELTIKAMTLTREKSTRSSQFRPLKRQLNMDGKVKAEQIRLKLQDACTTFDYSRPWKMIRKQGNTDLFLRTTKYVAWRDGSSSSTLVYLGIPGAGKSVMLANMVDNLYLSSRSEDPMTFIGFFFCQYGVKESLATSTIIGSLARQVLSIFKEDELVSVERVLSTGKNSSLSRDQLFSIVRFALTRGYKIIFILDGLDDCSDDTKAEVLSRLQDLQDEGVFQLCIALRQRLKVKDAIYVPMSRDNSDIANYVDSELELLSQTGQLAVTDLNIIVEIRDTLITQSNGMFLWAALQLSALCQMESDDAIMRALKSLPMTLHETYARMLAVATPAKNRYQKLILELILLSKRPLSVDELREALIIEPGNIQYDSSGIINDVYSLIASCGGLITVDEDDLTVNFFHFSVADFLLSRESAIFDYEDSSSNMVARILTYMNYNINHSQLVKATAKPLNMSAIPQAIISNAPISRHLAAALIKRGRTATIKTAQLNVSKVLGETAVRSSSSTEPSHPFASYVKAHWCDHLQDFQSENELCVSLLKLTLQNQQSIWPIDRGAKTPLVRSVVWNHLELFKILLQYGSFSARDRANALRVAEAESRDEILKEMISSNLFDTTSRTYQLTFVANLVDSLADQSHEQQHLEEVVKKLPHLLTRLAARLGYHKMGQRGQDAMVFILLARSNITNTFQEQWILNLQEKRNTEIPSVSWQDRVSLLGPRMGDDFMDTNAISLPRKDEDNPVLDELSYSETASQQSKAYTHTTNDSHTTGLTSAPSLNSFLKVNLSARSKVVPTPTNYENAVISTDDVVLPVATSSPLPVEGAEKTDVDIDFVLESSAYAWFVARVRNSFHVASSQNDAFAFLNQRLSECSLLRSSFGISSMSESQSIVLDLGWDIWSFLDGFHFGDIQDSYRILGNYLTLNSNGENVQALTCQQYMQHIWGNDSNATLSFVNDIVNAKKGLIDSPNCKIEGWKNGSGIRIKATGSMPEIAEILEQILWMGSSMRCGPTRDVLFNCVCAIGQGTHTSMELPDGQHITNVYQISVTYSMEKAVNTTTDTGSCWRDLFRYPVVAMGFPIAIRATPTPGLEMNLATMVSLSHSQHIGKFDNAIVIKGHSTMFTLSKRENGLCLWHVINNLDGSFIPYSAITNAGDFSYLSLHEIKQDRHFIGWCTQSSYCAGKALSSSDNQLGLIVLSGAIDGNYLIKRSYADRVVGASFFGERSLLRGIRVEDDTVYIAGDRHESRHTKKASFRKDINELHSNYIVLWDVGDERGWLTNGTSALLHLVFASLDHDAHAALVATKSFNKSSLKSAEQYTDKAAAGILLDADNLDLAIHPLGEDQEKFRDRVADLYHLLSMVIGYQLIASQKRLLSYSQLEGWDFMDIADTSTALLYPRCLPLSSKSSGWKTLLADIWAVTLFGRNFGEIFRPVDHATCSYWSQLPIKKSYLAASVSDLEQIMEKHGNPLKEPKRLTSNTAWNILLSTFDGCKCDESKDHHTVVQDLVTISGNESDTTSNDGSNHAPTLGAAIFGDTGVADCLQESVRSSSHEHTVELSLRQAQFRLSAGVAPLKTLDTRREIQVLTATKSQNISVPIPASSSKPAAFTPDDYLVAIICALPKELRAVLLLFDEKHEQVTFNSNDPYSYAFGKIAKHNIVAACLPKGQYGNCSATAVGTQLLQSFPKVKFVLLVGIGGGVPLDKDIRLGDVVVSSGYPGVVKYDFHKTIQGQPEKLLGGSFRPPKELTSLISQIEASGHEDFIQTYLKNIAKAKPEYAYPGSQCDVLYAAEFRHVGRGACTRCTGKIVRRSVRPSPQPRIHYGTIASGDQVMKDARIRDRIGRQHRALCFEMEAGGLIFLKDCLVIRGICDYSDSHKHDIWQNYACASAAAYAKLLLSQLKKLPA